MQLNSYFEMKVISVKCNIISGEEGATFSGSVQTKLLKADKRNNLK